MKVYELISFNKEFLLKIHIAGLKIDDYKYVDLYLEYQRLKNDGEKMTYIVSYLADKYLVSERQIYCIINRMQRDYHCK